jgi:urea transporter
VLCAIALGGLFFVLTWKSAIYALLAAMFSVPAFAAIAVLLAPIGQGLGKVALCQMSLAAQELSARFDIAHRRSVVPISVIGAPVRA